MNAQMEIPLLDPAEGIEKTVRSRETVPATVIVTPYSIEISFSASGGEKRTVWIERFNGKIAARFYDDENDDPEPNIIMHEG